MRSFGLLMLLAGFFLLASGQILYGLFNTNLDFIDQVIRLALIMHGMGGIYGGCLTLFIAQQDKKRGH